MTELTLNQILALIKKLQGEVHRDVRLRYGIEPPQKSSNA